eukprot:Rhum_TRINITY_DN2258_c0_g2::Rhum_TRINITY_DN2258_c0_g2_i1::g.6562::m.6562
MLLGVSPVVSLLLSDPCKLLDTVEENVTLLQELLVLIAPGVRLCRHNAAAGLVNLCAEAPRGNEDRELVVKELGRDGKSVGHGLQGNRPVRLQELLERNQTHLTVEVVDVLAGVHVLQHLLADFPQRLEELVVLAVVERPHEPVHVRDLRHHLQHLRRVKHLLLEGRPVKAHGGHQHREQNEVLVRDQLRGGERRQRAEKQVRGLLELPLRQQVHRLVHLQPVAALPVALQEQELVGRVDPLLDQLRVVVRVAQADPLERQVELRTEAHLAGLKGLLVVLEATLLVADLRAVVRLLQHNLTDLCLAVVLLCLGQLTLKLGMGLLVGFLHRLHLRLVDGPHERVEQELHVRRHVVRMNDVEDLLLDGLLVVAEAALACVLEAQLQQDKESVNFDHLLLHLNVLLLVGHRVSVPRTFNEVQIL